MSEDVDNVSEIRFTLKDAAIFLSHADDGSIVVLHDEAECRLQLHHRQRIEAYHENMELNLQTCLHPL